MEVAQEIGPGSTDLWMCSHQWAGTVYRCLQCHGVTERVWVGLLSADCLLEYYWFGDQQFNTRLLGGSSQSIDDPIEIGVR